MEVKGKIILIGETQSFGSNNFEKREVVLKTEEEYPQSIPIEFVQGKCSLLDMFEVDDIVTVKINIRGRKWTNKEGEDKYFLSLQGWRIDREKSQKTKEETQPPAEPKPQGTEEQNSQPQEEEDDLPF